MKQVDTKAYMTALRSLTEQGHSVSVPSPAAVCRPFWQAGATPCSFPGRTRPCAAATSCFTSARAASLSCIESAAYTVTVASTSLAMRRPRPRPASCRSRSLRGDRRLPKGSAASAWRFSVGALSRAVAVGHSAAASHCPDMERVQKAPDIIQLQYKITDCEKKSEVVSPPPNKKT